MNTLSTVKRACICAICVALCYVLPVAFHSVGLGSALSPMHIPVLLCGLICGAFYGAFCGIVGPILSSILSGMPPANALIFMIPELAVYGLVCGLMMKILRTGRLQTDVYCAMLPAMLLGRIAGGIARAIFMNLIASGEAFTLTLWISSYFIGGFPGIAAHLILVPILVVTLTRAKMIPNRY